MTVLTDEDYIIEEPCVSCEKSYVEDIWQEWCCDAKRCIHAKEYEENMRRIEEKKNENT